MHGQVVDSTNTPVEGAALMIDQKPIYTDSSGRFFLRERKPQLHKLTVLTDQFLADGEWEVVHAPTSIRSTDNESEPDIIIIVRRKAATSGQADQNENVHRDTSPQ